MAKKKYFKQQIQIQDEYTGTLPNTVSTMKRMVREPGSADQLKGLMAAATVAPAAAVASPAIIGSGALNPLMGKGLGGALLTDAVYTTDAEGGIFTELGKVAKNLTAKKGKGALVNRGAWVMSDGRRLYEIPTGNMADGFMRGTKNPFMTLKEKIGTIDNNSKMSIDDINKIKNAENIIKNHSQESVGFFSSGKVGMKNNSNGIFMPASDKSYVKKRLPIFGGKKKEFNTAVHEANHAAQYWQNMPEIKNHEYISSVPYFEKKFEVESRIAGHRAPYKKELTDANSKYGIHPEIYFDKAEKKFKPNMNQNDSEFKFLPNGKPRMANENDTKIYNNRKKILEGEASRLSKLYNDDKYFKNVIDMTYKYINQ